MSAKRPFRIAILDMYNNHPNEGLRNIKEIVSEEYLKAEWNVYDVRGKVKCLAWIMMSISLPEARQPYDGEDKQWEQDFSSSWTASGITTPTVRKRRNMCSPFVTPFNYWQDTSTWGRSVSGSQLPLVFSTSTRRKTPGKTLTSEPCRILLCRRFQRMAAHTTQC